MILASFLSIGIAQTLFAGLMFATKRPKNLADHYMAAWLLTICVDMLLTWQSHEGRLNYTFPLLQFSYGPFVYLYVSTITQEIPKFKIINLVHFIPTCLIAIPAIIFFNEIDYHNPGFLFESENQAWVFILGISFYASISIYFIYSLKKIKQYQKSLDSLFSYKSERITLNWLKALIIILIASYSLTWVHGALLAWGNPLLLINPGAYIITGLTLISFTISFFGFRQPGLFNELSGDFESTYNNERKKIATLKYESSVLKNEEAREFKKNLLELMEKDKPFLKGDLSVSELAAKLNISRHNLTQVLNNNIEKNFYNFINEYRADEAKKYLIDPKFSHYSIVAIAFESGFNSKTTFNTFFKSYCGLTPTDFKKTMAKSE